MATAVTAPSIDSNVSSFVARKQKLLINGKWVEAASGKTFASYNPATGEVLANVAEGDREDIDRAVKAARAAFETGAWSRISPAARGKMIWKLADLIEKHAEEFAQLEYLLDCCKCLRIALHGRDAAILVLHFATSLGDLPEHHPHRLEHIQWLESRNGDRFSIVPRDEIVRACPDHHAYMTGAKKAVQMQIRRV